jgi:CheY-like chemotaxis protein
VMDIAKIEGDRLDVSIEPVLIGELVTETVQLMMPTAAESEVTVRYRPGSLAEGERVLADRRRLRQVLLNLLSNAIKYNKPAGRVDVRCRRSRTRPGVLEVSVTDTGHGIAVQDLPRLFTPFDRLGAASGDIEGTGVGLALSQRLMTSMNGRLHASSQVGQGSTFTATMPLAPHPEPVDDAAAPRDTDRHPPVVPDNGPVSTLLFIEDNSSNVRLMERLVRQRPGWRMVVAGHGHLGLELAAGTRPDLVLLDMHLPDMNGLDVLHHLRADPKTSTIPVVVSSADANPHQIQRVLTAGAHRYLTKPLVVADVLELLDTNRRRSDPPAVQ